MITLLSAQDSELSEAGNLAGPLPPMLGQSRHKLWTSKALVVSETTQMVLKAAEDMPAFSTR